jgi:hypothetical protein
MDLSIFQNTRFQPAPDQTDQAWITDSMRDKSEDPIMIETPEEVPDVGVKYVVHLPTGDRHRQGVQRIVRPSSRSEPIREPEEILFVDGVEHHDASALDDLVLQGRDRQRPLSAIRLRYVSPT